MTIVRQGVAKHRCAPGWTFDADGFGHTPDPWTHPRGTVWECPRCRARWVSRGSVYVNTPGMVFWRRERLARRVLRRLWR